MRISRLAIALLAVAGVSLVGFLLVPRAPSNDVATSLLRAHPYFTTNRIAILPRSIYVNPGIVSGQYGKPSPYGTTELGFASPMVAALKAFHLVDVTEYVTPANTADLPMSQQNMSPSERRDALLSPAFAHTLMVQPLESLTTVAGFAAVDAETVNHDGRGAAITTVPGWQFPVAIRELVMVKRIERSQPSSLGDFDATVCWRWRSLPAGELFAVGSEAYDRITELPWEDDALLKNERAKQVFFDTDVHAAFMQLTRTNDRWRIVSVTSMDEDEDDACRAGSR